MCIVMEKIVRIAFFVTKDRINYIYMLEAF